MNLRRISISQFALFVTLLGTVTPAFADTVWTDGTGDWFNAANWSAGVPNSNTHSFGLINNGGSAQITASGAEQGASLGVGAQDSGTLSVSGFGRLDGEVDVGVAGTGTLSILSGGVVTSSRFLIASDSGSHGVATVSGSGSMWLAAGASSFIGFLGNATLNITNGGKVTTVAASIGESNGSVGVVTVDGPGSRWTLGAILDVAGDGTGTLTVTNGGKVFSEFGSGSSIGRNPGSNGVVTVSGSGSSWTTGPIAIGEGFAGATGALHIANGGVVSNTAGYVGGFGGVGAATVDGIGSTWTNDGDFFVGPYSDGVGVVTITQGGVVSSINGYVGFNGPPATGTTGTVEVDGTGAKWMATGNLYIGGSENGTGSLGVLRIENGGEVSATSTTVLSPGRVDIGLNPNLNGVLTFSGGRLRTVRSTTFAKSANLAGVGMIVESNAFDSILSGVFSGAGAFYKNSSGTITLTNANTYSGNTTITAGRLLANSASGSSTGTGTVFVRNPRAVFGGTGLVSGPTNVGNSAILLCGDATGTTGTLTLGSNLTFASGSVVQLVLGGSGAHSTLHRAGGTWTFLSNQVFAIINAGAQPGSYSGIITGLADDPGVGSWALAGSGFSGTFMYDGAGNINLNLTAVPPLLQLLSAASRKTHSAAGDFSVDLPLAGQPGVECRTGGVDGDHTLMFTFSNPIVSGNISVTGGLGMVTGAPTFIGDTMVVNLTGIVNAQILTVTLSSVNDSFSQILPDTTLSAGFLLGDTNGNGSVNAGDVAQTKAQSGQAVTAANFREDVNVNGSINAGDVALVKSKSGTSLP